MREGKDEREKQCEEKRDEMRESQLAKLRAPD